jgi:hypothetical protein
MGMITALYSDEIGTLMKFRGQFYLAGHHNAFCDIRYLVLCCPSSLNISRLTTDYPCQMYIFLS